MLLLLLAPAMAAAIPTSYQFYGLGDRLLMPESGFATDPFTELYSDRQLSVASAVNNNGFIIGFWLGSDEMFRTHSLQFGTNPLGIVRFSENFVGLSGSDVPCRSFLGILLCSNPEFPFGARIVPPLATDAVQVPTAQSAFLNTPVGSVAVDGSLPFMRYPGNFVEENASGVLASTQLSATNQYGVIVRAGVNVILEDVAWVVGINDLNEPLIIAYNGRDGGCLVYGPTCKPPLTPCEYDPNPGNGGTNGSEASGHAWGHNKCKDGVVDGNNGGGDNIHDNDEEGSGVAPRAVAPVVAQKGALLIHLKPDNSVVRYNFPSSVPLGISSGRATNMFPLAINETRVVLRGDVSVGNTVYEKRLLSCTIDTVNMFIGTNGIVDCIGGLQLIGGIYNSIRVGTVLGFTLTNNDLLTGNLGYNASGVGMPTVTDVAALVPTAELISNLSSGTDNWELNTVTDMNNNGLMSGYGYKDCSLTPEAFYISPLTSEPASGVRFVRGAFENPAWLAAGGTLTIAPTLTGGSGAYELRSFVKKPTEETWTMIADWGSSAGSWSAGSYQGEVCFRIEARDPSATAAAAQQMVVRYSVGVSTPATGTPGSDTGTNLLTPTQGDFEVGDLLAGSLNMFSLLMLCIAGLARRMRLRAHLSLH